MLTLVQKSQYGTPVFITPKREGTVRFNTDYCRLNQKLVRKPYPLPRIGDTMQQLEGFQYATELYLNMGYYTIRFSPAIQYTTMIVLEIYFDPKQTRYLVTLKESKRISRIYLF